jgi:hypothetical protein
VKPFSFFLNMFIKSSINGLMVSMLVRRAYQEACHIASYQHAYGRIFPFGRQVVQD